jgi:hypothetical protein
MTTAVTSLADRVRDFLDDYGDVSTTLSVAVTDAAATTITPASSDDISEGDWISVDFETMYVSGVMPSPPYTLTVRRGQRGSTAATHSLGATVLVNPVYENNRILNALNGALGKMTKTVKDVATLEVVENQYAYAVPSTIDVVRRVEIENSDEDSEFYIIRNWEMLDATYFRIFGNYPEDRNIGVVGTASFTALATTGNLDATYPDDNASAINFLVYEAAGQLLMQRQAKIANRDSFEGMTDAFAQSQPDHSLRVARYYLVEAERYRLLAVRQCPILQTPVSPTQNPGRSYLQRR